MSETVKMVRWSATPYGGVLAFDLATRAPCKTAEEFEHAAEVRSALRLAKSRHKADFEALPGFVARGDDEGFDRALAAFDCNSFDVKLTPGSFRWLRPMLDDAVLSGCFAAAKAAIVKSLADAKEIDAPLRP